MTNQCQKHFILSQVHLSHTSKNIFNKNLTATHTTTRSRANSYLRRMLQKLAERGIVDRAPRCRCTFLHYW